MAIINTTIINNSNAGILLQKKGVGKIRENCLPITDGKQVPSFLIDTYTVSVEGDTLTIQAVEGEATRQFSADHPVFLCWETLSEERRLEIAKEMESVVSSDHRKMWQKYMTTEQSFGSWPKDNGAETLMVKDGKCYNKPATVFATPITEDLPAWVLSAGFPVEKEGNKWVLNRTDWNEKRSGIVGQAYWVRYGEKDVNILTVTEPSAETYQVVDEHGNVIGDFLTVIGRK